MRLVGGRMEPGPQGEFALGQKKRTTFPKRWKERRSWVEKEEIHVGERGGKVISGSLALNWTKMRVLGSFRKRLFISRSTRKAGSA